MEKDLADKFFRKELMSHENAHIPLHLLMLSCGMAVSVGMAQRGLGENEVNNCGVIDMTQQSREAVEEGNVRLILSNGTTMKRTCDRECV
ncbi:uncharacterized protein MONOS_15202 [Monocercomonoides exilis]|uniref:uncharacterized protein n=1 Tax=Monocercomonoides exilis TaxID=2049356 RepID=UPI00355A9773|nr:hypothetical protein MONOS_15202 [Monocercomonoides exilis]|eukprot:MONOS_15202.1-p1 / transcript=MONOS_15202.1 / gene=MONOS_15202 / organism=Monocercomonoides_exilis_PA203 / gene_product=unspecified product / transcript_product=unspecified product / location=Mono_scaffold01169:7045-7380(-) / protein_length=90 / sequence_SO=supercontig / SO=protein_coding / is_pseudo=false